MQENKVRVPSLINYKTQNKMVESINVKHETVKRTEKHRKQEQIIDKFVHVK